MACYWQLTINVRIHTDSPDRETNDWIYLLLINSCTPCLREQINTKYKAVDHWFQYAITYTWLLFQYLFAHSLDSTSLLLKFIDIFAKKGLMHYKGERMVRAKLEVSAACCRLHEAGNLPDKVSIDILK